MSNGGDHYNASRRKVSTAGEIVLTAPQPDSFETPVKVIKRQFDSYFF